MGTRGAYGFRVDGQDKVTYNRFDSYPGGLGEEMIGFIRQTPDSELLAIAKRLKMVDGNTAPTEKQIEQYRDKTLDLSVSGQTENEWYCLLRDAQGKPNMWKGTVNHMIEGASFLGDSLFCEWAYIINVDIGVLEVYKGFNKNPDAPGRYAALSTGGNEYSGVALIDEVPFSYIRKTGTAKLIARWEKRDEEEED